MSYYSLDSPFCYLIFLRSTHILQACALRIIMLMNILVFDIETIPDVESGRHLFDLHGLSDEETALAMFSLRKAAVGHDFLPHHLQKICAISLVMRNGSQIKVWSLGNENSDEKEIITRFFAGIDKHTPTLISW